MERVFITADTHFCHEIAPLFAGRVEYEFANWEAMNEELVYRWNSVVNPGDTVIHLGDVALCGGDDFKRKALDDVMQRLNGFMHLVAGNHDQPWVHQYFETVHGVRERKRYVLSHIPVHPSQKYRFRINVHGHTHNSVLLNSDLQPDLWYYCASVEQHELAPVPWDEIQAEYKRRKELAWT